MKDECLICGAPLVYLQKDEPMECAICHRQKKAIRYAKMVTTYATSATRRAWTAL